MPLSVSLRRKSAKLAQEMWINCATYDTEVRINVCQHILSLSQRLGVCMSLFIRIWLSFLITLGAILLLLYTAIQWSFSNGLIRYINQREAATYQMLSQNIATFYVLSEEPSLLEQNSFYWRQLLALSESGETLTETRLNDWKIQHLFEPDKPPRRKHHNNYSRGNPSDREHKPPRRPPPNDHLPISLLSKDMRPIYGPFKQDFSVLPVNVNGAIIANIAWPSSRIPESTYDVAFAESQKHAFLMLASLALVFGAILALFFSRRFTNPLDDIANTTQKLAHGDYDARTTTINVMMRSRHWATTSIRLPPRLNKQKQHGETGSLALPMNSERHCLSLRGNLKRFWMV
ncbi:hypothetical protein AT251_19735 [Enterovibrio nigricans]|nr:hypothetical protein AT251_19735 [Enterovibrio nigricans]